jgi:hypothetical protein
VRVRQKTRSVCEQPNTLLSNGELELLTQPEDRKSIDHL